MVERRGGRIRIVDCANAKNIDDPHTRAGTVFGRTPGYSSESLYEEKQTIAEDVSQLCVVAFEWLTGKTKGNTDDEAVWHRLLIQSGLDSQIAKVIVKGMRPRRPKLAFDPRVFHSAMDVIRELEHIEQRRTNSRKRFWMCTATVVIAMVLGAIAYFGYDKYQNARYYTQKDRIEKTRGDLESLPMTTLADVRVRKLLQQAEVAEEDAKNAKSANQLNDAVAKLVVAEADIEHAFKMAENLSKLKPLLEPLRAILIENDQWNRENAFINRRLIQLGEEYQTIQSTVESGEPDEAWNAILELQPKLVGMIKENQQSLEIETLMEQLNGQNIGLDSALTKMTAYQNIRSDCQRAKVHFTEGKWTEARTELIGAMASMERFLKQHEPESDRLKRMASNAETVAAQLAANESLREQVASLQHEIELNRQSYQAVFTNNANLESQNKTLANQNSTLESKLNDFTSKLQKAEAAERKQRDEIQQLDQQVTTLADWKKQNAQKIVTYEAELKKGSDQIGKQRSEISRLQALLDSIGEAPGSDPKLAKQRVELAKAEQAIQQFDPQSIDEADKRLEEESERYQALITERNQEIAIGKTPRHKDVRSIDDQLESQLKVVSSALKKRDAMDQKGWEAIQTQVVFQNQLLQATLDEGWAASSPKAQSIAQKIEDLSKQQERFRLGRTRLAAGNYDFDSWEQLARALGNTLSQSVLGFGALRLGTKFTNSLGQDFVYLPAGEFDMGSPTNEDGHQNDETLHPVVLTQGFFVATKETTQSVYQAITGQTPWKGLNYVKEGADYPAVYVSWDDITTDFLPKINARERNSGKLPAGWEYRLLTEAQWEYAARAGESKQYFFGDDPTQLGEYAWYDENTWIIGEKYAHRVATKKPNLWGLFDMLGNTWEWTADGYADYPEGNTVDPFVPDGSSRTNRGGSFSNAASCCRSAFRRRDSPGNRVHNLDFRLACIQLAK